MYCLSLFVLLICFAGSCLSRNIIGNCLYVHDVESLTGPYECVFSSQPFKNEHEVTHINGTHVGAFTDDDVTTVRVPRDSIMPTVPTIICEKFKNLQNFIMTFVGLRTITENTFSSCRNLENLGITQNRLREITANAFENNLELRSLRLSDNELIRIEDNAFRNLAKLELLELHRNQIMQISSETFTGLTSLTSLTIFRNFIPELPLNCFGDLVSLQNLELFINEITSVHPDFLESLPDTQMQLLLFNNICINQAFTFTKETIDEIKPHFSECFNNYINRHR